MPRIPVSRIPIALFILAAAVSTPLSAQVGTPEQPPQTLGATFTTATIADLPTGSNVYSLLDTALPEVIADRVDAGGLTAGEAALVGARGSSWTQTVYRVGDTDVTDPAGSGTPLLLPGLQAWERVDVNTGMMPVDLNAPGLAVTLVPRRPSGTWTSTIDVSGAGPAFLSRTRLTSPPPITRANAWSNGTIFLSGPIVPGRVGIVATGGWSSSSLYERANPTLVDSTIASGFTHLVFTPTPTDEVRFVGWGEHATHPDANRIVLGQPDAEVSNTSVHGQAVWDRTLKRVSWTVYGGAARREETSGAHPTSQVVLERLEDGPVRRLLEPRGTDMSWSGGARLKPASFASGGLEHSAWAGLSIVGGNVRSSTTFNGRIGETVDGVPARVWDYTSPILESRWNDTTIAAYAADHIRLLPRLSLDTGIRFEALNASAEGAAGGISWRNWFPRDTVRWDVSDIGRIAVFASFGRYGYRLPLSDLAYGDPSAPVGSVYRWNATTAATDPLLQSATELVARVGPGTGGNPLFSAIDPDVHRPYLDEFVIGLDSSPGSHVRYRMGAIARREKQLIGVVDVGVPDTTYSTISVPDPVNDKYSEQTVKAYNRSPGTYGADRYLLTNPPEHESTYVGLELSAQGTFDRFSFAIGGTAGRSEGLAADVGFTAVENDQGSVGDLFIDPNARTHAQGRLFTERGYTAKTSGVYRFAHDVTLGVIARYQDGQHFARVLTVTGLNQGAEAIRAFRNGRTRFTYTLTVDARLQKGFSIANRHVVLVLDGYNLFNTATEIEEIAVTGPDSRMTSATQPPRALHAGLKFSF